MIADKFIENCLLVYSKTSAIKLIKFFNPEMFANRIEVNSMTDYRDLSKYINKYKVIFGFGGGTAIDIAKYIAFHSKAKCIAIPTMLSTNVFSTNKTCVKFDGVKSTEQSLIPKVILDKNILNFSKIENLYGLVDVLSIYTASKDWYIADKNKIESIEPKIMQDSQKILDCALNFDIKSNDWEFLYKIIRASGCLTNDYGSGRPESGSEHIFSKYLEERLKIPHAVGVSIGIVAMSNINGGYQKDKKYYQVLNKLKETQIFDKARELGVSFQDVRAVLSIIEPRKDRYTRLNTIDIDLEKTLGGIANEIELC